MQLQSLACNDVHLLLEGFAPRCTNRNIVVAWTHHHGLQIPKRSSIAAIDKYVSFFDMSVELYLSDIRNKIRSVWIWAVIGTIPAIRPKPWSDNNHGWTPSKSGCGK